MRSSLWILALVFAAVTAVHAQIFRQLPANGKLGQTGQQQAAPLIQIDNNVLRLAPGGRIYDENNRSLVHGSLPPNSVVLFVLDMNGDLSRVIILRADELEQIRQRQQ